MKNEKKTPGIKKNPDFDIEAAIALEQMCFPEDAWSEKMTKEHFFRGRGIALADDSGYILYLETAEEIEILRIGVIPHKRNQGLGALLLGELYKSGKRILLEVRQGNLVAIRLYEKTGMKNIGVRKNYYSDGENALIYEFFPQAKSPR